MKKQIKQAAIIGLIAFVGYAILTIPGQFIDQYEAVRAHGQIWAYIYIGALCLGLLLLAGSVSWALWIVFRNTRKGSVESKASSAPVSSISEEEKLRQIRANIEKAGSTAEKSQKDQEFRKAIEEAAERIRFRLENQILEIAAVGTVSSGKSSLLNALAGRRVFDAHVAGGTTKVSRQIDLPGGDQVRLVDTPGLAEAGGGDREELARQAAVSADVVLFVLDGPLKAFELRAISRLCSMEKKVIVCLNKQDWYSPEDQEILMARLREQLKGLVDSEDVVAVQARKVTHAVTRIAVDGTEREVVQMVPPDITALAERMSVLMKGQRRQIILCSLLLQSRTLRKDAEERVRRIVVSSARRVVDSYTWKAALAAAASPTPVLDVAVGLGFSLKMILEIAAVFERRIELSDARELLNQLMKNLYASLGASALAPAVAQVVASGLKGLPAAGTLGGGALQGVVQAVVTRWIGMVMIDYFQLMKEKEGAADLQTLAMEEWKRITSASQLASLAAEGMKRFRAAGEGKQAGGRERQ